MTNKIKTGEIICVGTELLLGQIINTNAAWLAKALSDLGVSSYYQTVVGDNRGRLLDCLEQASKRSDLIVLTGGLGPTQDDITMSVAAEFCGQPLMMHEPSRSKIAGYFKKMGRLQVTDNNWKQAMFPRDATVMENNNGTAPGARLRYESNHKSTHLVLLPGPPSEMRPMFSESVKPWLAEMTATRLRHLFVRMIGIGESSAETQLLDLIEQQQNPTLAPYASEGEVVFRITQSLKDVSDPDLTQDVLNKVKARLGKYIYEVGERKMPEVVKDMLEEKGMTISFAESCTAGLAAATLAQYPGASHVLTGGLVAYDNQVKNQILGVDQAILDREGAVSEACAVAMATGCRDVFKTDFSVSITGIAGPEGGTPEKPVGTVWLAAASVKGTSVRKLQMGGNRERIRRVSVLNAFDLIRQQILLID